MLFVTNKPTNKNKQKQEKGSKKEKENQGQLSSSLPQSIDRIDITFHLHFPVFFSFHLSVRVRGQF